MHPHGFEELMSSHERRPAFGRDSIWLASADVVAVLLAFVGQLILARALISESYGLFVIAIDLFATLFLLLDLGLPTLLARDGPRQPSAIWSGMMHIYRLQGFVVLIVAPVLVLIVLLQTKHDTLMLLGAFVALVHIASYAPRTALRAAGDARYESMTKVIERLATTVGYAVLFYSASTDAIAYATAFLFGAILGLLLALIGAYRVCSKSNEKRSFSELGSDWVSKKSILLAALPFAVTLGVLPYVIRIEKFILAKRLGFDEVALFHVGQLAWLAGLLVPQAMRAALLPVLGASRNEKLLFNQHLNRVEAICFALAPIGMVAGAIVVWVLLPLGFPSEYFDGSLGASATDVFMILLAGWAFTVLSVPSYTALQAGERPWLFTLLILVVVLSSTVFGVAFIHWGAQRSVGFAIEMAAYASVASSLVMLLLGIVLSRRVKEFKHRGRQWFATLVVVFVVSVALSEQSYWFLLGLGLFTLLPQGFEAVRTTVEKPTMMTSIEAE